MRETGRRLAPRTPLRKPIEAELRLCRGECVTGWIVEEQDDGLGMVFGAEDADRLLAHHACCVGDEADLALGGSEASELPIPVRLAHATALGEERVCRAGLAYDVRRFRAQDIARLLRLWIQLVAAGPRKVADPPVPKGGAG